MLANALLLGLFGCSSSVIDLSWQDDAFFQISGEVDPELVIDESEIYGAIVWIWSDEDVWRGQVERTSFEARLLSYRMGIPGPPSADTYSYTNALTDELQGFSLLVGVPIVYQGLSPTTSAFEIDPAMLWSWLSTSTGLEQAIRLENAHIIGTPSQYVVLTTGTPEGDAPCGFEQVGSGLTLYRADGEGCERWRPLADAGTRTEFQGVDLWPLE